MKKLLYLLLPFAWIAAADAQEWSYYKDFPINVVPVDIDSNNNGTLFMLTSDSRIFYKTAFGSWTEMGDGMGLGPISPSKISVHKSSNQLFVGDQFSGGIYRSPDFGNTWHHHWLTTNSITGLHEPVEELSNITNTDLFYAGSFDGFVPQIIRYTNQGQNGQIIPFDPNNNPQNLVSEVCVTSNQKVLIGTYAGGIWRSDNGVSYTQTNFNAFHVHHFTEGENGLVYALGTDEDGLDFLVTSTDYNQWTAIDLPNATEKYTAIYYDQPSHYLWLGSETGMYKMLVTSTSTTAWIDASYNNGEQFIVEFAGDNQNNVFNFSNQDVAQILSPMQNNWGAINEGLTGIATKVGFGPNNKMYASSYYTNNISSAVTAAVPWQNINLGGQNTGIRNMYVKSNGKVYASTAFYIKKSTDNGLTYSDITPPNLSIFLDRFYVGESGRLYMVQNTEPNKLYWSQNDGQTWSLLHTFPSFFDFFTDPIDSIAEDSNGVIYVTMLSLDPQFKVYYSTNNGASWNIKVVEEDNLGSSGINVFSKANQTFVAVGGYMFKFDYTNNSQPFAPIQSPLVADGFGNAMYIDNMGNYYVFGYDLYKSSDSGENWTNLGRPSAVNSFSVNDVLFDQQNQAYIVVTDTDQPNERGIYKVTETLGTQIPQNENPIGIYPNPAQHTLTIAAPSALQSVSLFDMLGKKVLAPQLTTNTIDVSGLAQGVYLVKVVTQEAQSTTIKLIKR